MFYRFLLAASAAVFLPFSLGAQEAGEAADICPRIQASTVFVDDKTGSRKRGSADRISETHKTAERQGWDLYYNTLAAIENGVKAGDEFALDLRRTAQDLVKRSAL